MRRKLIRTLTILFGLYFFLEFFLPKEIGGNFDKTAIRSPSVLHDAGSGEYRMYYVGVYNRRTKSVGLATSKDDVTWEKEGDGPVIRSTLFNSVDRLGFSSLCPLKVGDGYELYYLGANMETPPLLTVCWADSSDGVLWQKHGRVEFTSQTPWQQREELAESIANRATPYGQLRAMAPAVINGIPTLYIAELRGSKTEVLLAQRTGPDGQWALRDKPIDLGGMPLESNVVSLSYLEKDGTPELWVFLEDKSLYRVRPGPEPSAVRILGKPLRREAEGTPRPAAWTQLKEALSPFRPLERMGKKVVEELAFIGPWLEGGIPRTDMEYGPAYRFFDLIVTAVPDGYRMFYTKPYGKGVPEDEVPRTLPFTTTSADGTTWKFFRNSERVLDVGAPSQPTYVTRAFEFMGTFLMVLGAFTVGIGGINMTVLHGRKVIRGGKGFQNSAVFFMCFIFMFIGTMWGKPIVDRIKKVQSATANKEEVEAKTQEIESEYSSGRVGMSRVYDFVFNYVNAPLGATLFSLVSFYMVGAAFRSFRVKSMEAGFLILSAIIVLIGQIPIGTYLSSWLPLVQGQPAIPWLKDQLLTVLNAAAYRAVLLGMAIAAVSTSVRLWLGLEKGMFHGT
jgi:hypothetical protein